MRSLAIILFAIAAFIGGCDENTDSDALIVKIEEEKEKAEERRKVDDPTTFAKDPPAGIKFGSDLK